MRRWCALLLLPVVVACGGPAATEAAQRPGAVVACPVPLVGELPADLPKADSATVNLGDGLMGHVVTWQRTAARRVVASVGKDPLDALEDLDMQARTATIGGRQVSISTTDLQPGLAVIALSDVGLPEACGELALLTERLTDRELAAAVGSAGVEIAAPEG